MEINKKDQKTAVTELLKAILKETIILFHDVLTQALRRLNFSKVHKEIPAVQQIAEFYFRDQNNF